MKTSLFAPIVIALSLTFACAGSDDEDTTDASKEALDAFLINYAKRVKPAYKKWKMAEWTAHTRVRADDTEAAEVAAEAREAWQKVVADNRWTQNVRDLLRAAEETNFDEEGKTPPTDLQLDGLRAIQRLAATNRPRILEAKQEVWNHQTNLIRRRLAAEYDLDGQPITAAALSERLATSRDVAIRRDAWEALQDPARELKPEFPRYRDARNTLAKRLGHSDHLEASASRYNMKAEELAAWLRQVEVALRPLYRELHTWLRHELAEDYLVEEVPEGLPAHWLGDPDASTMSATVELPSLDVRDGLEARGTEAMLHDAAAFFEGVGLAALPEDFWTRSSLYPRLDDQKYGKLGGASTWNIDLRDDVRVLLSARAEPLWMHAAYRELAFVHAHYARKDAGLPTAMRIEAPTGLDASLAIWADIAGTRAARLDGLGLLPEDIGGEFDDMLQDALTYVPHVHFLAGPVAAFEREVYIDGLPTDQLNTRWWALIREHQGIVPPTTRTERWADPLRFTPLIDHPGSATEQAIAVVVAWQLQTSLADSLGLDPRDADFAGHPEAGEVFRRIAANAGREDWRELLEGLTGGAPSADAMAAYFEPLRVWLSEQNEDRTHTVPRLR